MPSCFLGGLHAILYLSPQRHVFNNIPHPTDDLLGGIHAILYLSPRRHVFNNIHPPTDAILGGMHAILYLSPRRQLFYTSPRHLHAIPTASTFSSLILSCLYRVFFLTTCINSVKSRAFLTNACRNWPPS